MKFLYEYRTSDNVRHGGEIFATNREEAFSRLRSQGIRPGLVVEAPGFFNKMFGKGKRWMAIGVLGLVAVSFALIAHRSMQVAKVSQDIFDNPTRRQIMGDSAVISKGIRSAWSDVFKEDGDRFLASFAIPGVPAALRNTTAEALQRVLDSRETAKESDSIEVRQIKAIVCGMKDEIAECRKRGWTLKEVGSALAKRQDREIGYYQRAKNELRSAISNRCPRQEVEKIWERWNVELRNMGIQPLPFPEG